MKDHGLMKMRRYRHYGWTIHSGQTIIEYTILLAAIAAVTYIGTAAFFSRVCKSNDASTPILKSYFNRVVDRIR